MSASFEDLEVWKKACRLAVRLYSLLKESRDYGMKDQMLRAAVSIASNIAEGSERNSLVDFRRYLSVAKGSAAELRTQVYISGSIGILNQKDTLELVDELKTISKMLQGLAASLKGRRARIPNR
ncbi:MAG TPA: four helix bundle protein [Chitinivibrionales bacterium]|nr:four helix bundle protein [Chitinivibrionales bacterium]